MNQYERKADFSSSQHILVIKVIELEMKISSSPVSVLQSFISVPGACFSPFHLPRNIQKNWDFCTFVMIGF